MNVAWNCSLSLSASALSPSNLISSDITRSTVSFVKSSRRSCARGADNECKKFHERTSDDGGAPTPARIALFRKSCGRLLSGSVIAPPSVYVCTQDAALEININEISALVMVLAETEGFEPSIGLYNPITV